MSPPDVSRRSEAFPSCGLPPLGIPRNEGIWRVPKVRGGENDVIQCTHAIYTQSMCIYICISIYHIVDDHMWCFCRYLEICRGRHCMFLLLRSSFVFFQDNHQVLEVGYLLPGRLKAKGSPTAIPHEKKGK